MKRTLKPEDIARFIPYGLRVRNINSEQEYKITGFESESNDGIFNLLVTDKSKMLPVADYVPVLRSMNDLIKTMEDGKIPLIEIFKDVFPPIDYSDLIIDTKYKYKEPAVCTKPGSVFYSLSFDKNYYMFVKNNFERINLSFKSIKILERYLFDIEGLEKIGLSKHF